MTIITMLQTKLNRHISVVDTLCNDIATKVKSNDIAGARYCLELAALHQNEITMLKDILD